MYGVSVVLVCVVLVTFIALMFVVLTGDSECVPCTQEDSSECPSPSPTPSPTPSPNQSTSSPVDQLYFIEISDIHLDLNYTSDTLPLAHYGVNGGELLLNTTLSQAKAMFPNPAFILVTGDLVAYDRKNAEEQFATVARASKLIQEHFPSIPVFPALGNNDVYPDYCFPLNENTEWMTQLSNLWSMWLNEGQLATFNPNGYYTVEELWTNGPKLIVLNSLLYSINLAIGDCKHPALPSDLPEDPNNQFQWLEEQLTDSQANSQQVIIQYHIPSGYNAFQDGSVTWHEKYMTTFNQLCSNYTETILVHMAAHYHTDEFRLLEGLGAVLLNPSISPSHTNNPSFRVFNVNSAGVLYNYHQYFMDLVFGNQDIIRNETPKFTLEYDLQSLYGTPQVDGESISSILDLLSNSTLHYMSFLSNKYVSYPLERGKSLCAMKYQSKSENVACRAQLSDDED